MGEERDCNDGPPLEHHSIPVCCFRGVLGCFSKLSWLWNSLLLSFLAVFSQQATVLPGSAL